MWTPRMRPAVPSGRRSATTFTKPSVSPMIRARLLPPKGSFFVTTSSPSRQCLGFGQPGERDLGVAVDGPGHLASSRPAQQARRGCDFDHHDRLGEAHVGQLGRSGDHVAHRPHVRARGSAESLGHHEASLVKTTPVPSAKQTLGARPATDRDHDHRHLHLATVGERDDGAQSVGTSGCAPAPGRR